MFYVKSLESTGDIRYLLLERDLPTCPFFLSIYDEGLIDLIQLESKLDQGCVIKVWV